jgi:hypothetical protein
MASPACKPMMGMEICDNGIDDNNNNLVDCTDPQCVSFPACLTTLCQPEIDFGTIQQHDSSVTRVINTQGAVQSFATCAANSGSSGVLKYIGTILAFISHPGLSRAQDGVVQPAQERRVQQSPFQPAND